MQDKWPELVLTIDMEELNKLNWDDLIGTELEDQAEKALATLSKFLREETFEREDYKEFCELAVLFLGGSVSDFKFQYPGAHHHARFMASSIYMLIAQDGSVDGQDQLVGGQGEEGGEGHGRVHLHLLRCLVVAGIPVDESSHE